MFYGCFSLNYLPDISKWDIDNINNINYIFNRCSSLTFLPDISKWEFEENTKMHFIFNGCLSLSFIPYNFKKNINEINQNQTLYEFINCANLK